MQSNAPAGLGARIASGFTLLEMLIVVAIVSILLSISLPSLQGARAQARTAVCGTRLAELCRGMQMYASDHHDAIVGSATTSGSYFFFENLANNDDTVTGLCTQPWDWIGPIAKTFQAPFSQKKSGDLFNAQRAQRMFECPSNKFVATHWIGSAIHAGPGRMVSYNTSETFMYASRETDFQLRRPIPHPQEGGGLTTMPIGWVERLPAGYIPRVDRVGNPADKVFLADGARYSSSTTEADYDLSRYARFGGAYSDAGPYSDYTKGWNRIAAFGSPLPIRVDPRIYAYRHGVRRPFRPLGEYKMQMGFFDGHVDTMNDKTSANPHHWLPRGTRLNLNDRHIYEDVRQRFGGGWMTIR